METFKLLQWCPLLWLASKIHDPKSINVNVNGFVSDYELLVLGSFLFTSQNVHVGAVYVKFMFPYGHEFIIHRVIFDKFDEVESNKASALVAEEVEFFGFEIINYIQDQINLKGINQAHLLLIRSIYPCSIWNRSYNKFVLIVITY